jgi:GR25 family glycosyltransferase involved in LPS biosynthesis
MDSREQKRRQIILKRQQTPLNMARIKNQPIQRTRQHVPSHVPFHLIKLASSEFKFNINEKKKKIGLVITLFNRPEYLEKTLESIKNSNLENTEIFMVNDASTNFKTNKLFDDFEINNVKITKVRNSTNQNMFYGLKLGFDYFFNNNFDILCNLDSDVLVKPYWLDVLLRLHNAFPNNIISGFNTLHHPIKSTFSQYYLKETVGGANLFFDRKLYKTFSSCFVNTDWDFSICRIFKNKKIDCVVSNPSVVQHIGAESSLINHKENNISNDFKNIRINDYFDKIFCINLKRRTDRLFQSMNELDKHGIYIEREEAVDGNEIESKNEWMSSSRIACCLSHMNILKKMIENNWEKVLIFEDDIKLSDNFKLDFLNKINNVPDYDILYLCGNNPQNLKMINKDVAKIDQTLSCVAYAVSLNFAKKILPEIEKLNDPIDVIYSKNSFKFNYYIFNPYLSTQRADFSDIEKRYVDYSNIIIVSDQLFKNDINRNVKYWEINENFVACNGGLGDVLLGIAASYAYDKCKLIHAANHGMHITIEQFVKAFDIPYQIKERPFTMDEFANISKSPWCKSTCHLPFNLDYRYWGDDLKFLTIPRFIPLFDLFGKHSNLVENTKDMVVICPRGSNSPSFIDDKNGNRLFKSREISQEEYKKLVNNFIRKNTVIVLGSPNDLEYYGMVDHANFFWLCFDKIISYKGEFTVDLKTVLSIVNGCKLVISVDTWLKTYSAIAGLPTIVLKTRFNGGYLTELADMSENIFLNKKMWNLKIMKIEDML